MKVTEREKKLLEELFIFGRIIGKYKLGQKYINDLNLKYENAKTNLASYGPRLAGRLDSELDMMNIIESTSAFKKLAQFIDNYIELTKHHKLIKNGIYNLDIIGCWMNDMLPGEYNPVHTHHNNTGYSTVLFLKVPEFINDAKDPHKFQDGELTFINIDGSSCTTVAPQVGDFYVFQASHMHCVNPFKTKSPKDIRRSMSFNFILKELKKEEDV